MTDFSRNQITSAVKLKSNQVDRWVIPNDRQLSLRARLGSGWSVRTNRSSNFHGHGSKANTLTAEELHHIRSVINKANSLEQMEQHRIGSLVNEYQRLKSGCRGNDSKEKCCLCGEKFNAFKLNSKVCQQCDKIVCADCITETQSSSKEKLVLCNLCGEKRELWKKTGAWFFGGIPHHVNKATTPSSDSGSVVRSRLPSSSHSSTLLRKDGMVRRRPTMERSVSILGQERDVKIMRCKPDVSGEDSDSDTVSTEGSTGTASYSESLQRFKRTEADMMSLDSRSLTLNPKSMESIHTAANEESATESVQDLRLMSLIPQTPIDYGGVQMSKSKGAVSFHPETMSQKSDGFVISPKSQFEDGVPRCISIPNADLKDIHYHEEVDTDSPYGSLIFTLFYQELEETLEIEMIGARHLPDSGVSYNPYVSINLVPSLGNSRRQRTQTENNTRDPQWKQKISYFGIPMDELLFKSLVFSVYSERMLGADDLIAEYRMELRQLESYELTHYHVYMEQTASSPTDEVAGDDIGKVQLSTRYDTSTSQLYVGVVRCAALHLPNNEGYADPYVKLYLLPDSSKSSKRKTAVKRRTLNPEFHEEFIYKVALDSLSKLSLEVTVWDHNMTRNVFLGGIYLSNYSSSVSEKIQWNAIVQHPDRRHDSWHCLRDIINK